ncbi:hypothetical protein M0813_24235 [Anaeramoeba flamelloides]|uniref:Uncharacterized protein n=1 Tax=Anaeramoeba flamelloides TaxID=1746091 RepID=A0ABQ8Y893_9EUKA|nr:hypothetical protein M0813_24235 [Anaeramoeba flamelloides]
MIEDDEKDDLFCFLIYFLSLIYKRCQKKTIHIIHVYSQTQPLCDIYALRFDTFCIYASLKTKEGEGRTAQKKAKRKKKRHTERTEGNGKREGQKRQTRNPKNNRTARRKRKKKARQRKPDDETQTAQAEPQGAPTGAPLNEKYKGHY